MTDRDLTEYEARVLREIDGQLLASPFSERASLCRTKLRGMGFIDRLRNITPAGRAWLDAHPLVKDEQVTREVKAAEQSLVKAQERQSACRGDGCGPNYCHCLSGIEFAENALKEARFADTFDPTKPFTTRDGQEVKNVRRGAYIEGSVGGITRYWLPVTGKYHDHSPHIDLVNVPTKPDEPATRASPGAIVTDEMVEAGCRELALYDGKDPDRETSDHPAAPKVWQRYEAEIRLVLEAALAAQPALVPTDDGWSPIETAPRDGARLLLAKGVGHPDHASFWWWMSIGKWSSRWSNWNDGVEPSGLADPTHWRPLPSPPGQTAAPKPTPSDPVAIVEALRDQWQTFAEGVGVSTQNWAIRADAAEEIITRLRASSKGDA